MQLSRRWAIASLILQLLAAAILFQTLFFKFTGAEESRLIFRSLGLEPAGRIGTGIAELVAVALLLSSRTAVYGALLGLAIISGAIASHLTVLGIVVQNDGGLLFGLALIVFACCTSILLIRRRQLPVLGPRLARERTAPAGATN